MTTENRALLWWAQQYIQNFTIIGPVVSEIICLEKIDTDDRQTDGNGRPFFLYSKGIKRREKMKAANRPMKPITKKSVISNCFEEFQQSFELLKQALLKPSLLQ